MSCKKYILLFLFIRTVGLTLGQSFELVDLGWRYDENAIRGYVSIKNTWNDTLIVRSIKGSEDDVISYSPARIQLLPGEQFIACYTSRVLHRIFSVDSSIVCNYSGHSQKSAFNIAFQIYTEFDDGQLHLSEIRFTPTIENLNNISFCSEEAPVEDYRESLGLKWRSDLGGLSVDSVSVKHFVLSGYVVFAFDRNITSQIKRDDVLLKTKLSGMHFLRTHTDHVFGDSIGPNYIILKVYLTCKQRPASGKNINLTLLLTSESEGQIGEATATISQSIRPANSL